MFLIVFGLWSLTVEGANISEFTVADAQPSGGAVCAETQSITKRNIKLMEKALLEKLDTLQKTRKSKLNKASNLKTTIQQRMWSSSAQCFLTNMSLCAMKESHESLLKYLPPAEREKHEIWFNAKLLGVNEFTEYVNKCVHKPVENVENSDCIKMKSNPVTVSPMC